MTAERILVVGGAGYIGAHTCKALALAGFLPVTYDNLSTGHRDFVRWGPLVEGDIRDAAAVAAAVRTHGAVAAIHFAGSAYVGESMVNPAKYYENNVVGSLSLLNGLRAAGCDKLVFSSTCAVYGQPEHMPIDESVPTVPVNPYGQSKRMVEHMLADFGMAYGLKSVVLRYFNACGADLAGELGELRDPETHIIPRALMTLQGYIDDFAVFGSDFPTPDGTAVRDYIHVVDLADAHVLALQRLLRGETGGTFNLGTGEGYSIRQVLGVIEDVTGLRLPEVVGGRRAGDPAILVANATRARDELGFETRHSGLRQIIETAWRWHLRAHPRRNAPVGAVAAEVVAADVVAADAVGRRASR
ncbi:UDP-glucose 4-epimerase GalE [Ancylobacter oerskovii]|uniref:UDP-glucose 4-epimerase n=1 Tax=Ancylobacter oerskovii TaxID=459519 RepID=A0ABW4YWJ5_9HYPH